MFTQHTEITAPKVSAEVLAKVKERFGLEQLVMLAASVSNDCGYCRTVHVGLGRQAGIDASTCNATIEARPLEDRRLNALRELRRLGCEARAKLEGIERCELRVTHSTRQRCAMAKRGWYGVSAREHRLAHKRCDALPRINTDRTTNSNAARRAEQSRIGSSASK